MGKYNNKVVENIFGRFDSTDEYRRFLFLKDAEQLGEISNLRRQVKYVLLPQQKKIVIKHLKTKDKEVEREVAPAYTYTADFVYEKRNGETVVEDFKGYPNDRWTMKKAMMYYFHGIEVREVKRPAEPI